MRPELYEDIPPVSDVAGAARILDVSEDTIRRMVERQELGHVRLGRLVRIPRHRILELLDRNAGAA